MPLAAEEPSTVLLTGVTGFLGRFLCLHWLQRLAPTGGTVIALVRAATPEDARARIDNAVATDPDLAGHFAELAADHLTVLVGDLGQPHLGLNQDTWAELAQSVDLIVHAGALVNHALPYDQMFAPNVAGTAEVIRLALTTTRKPINYVSTIAATFLPNGRLLGEDEDIRQASPSRHLDIHEHAGGYTSSKWAGEILIRNAHDNYGLPVTVFRSNMILAHRFYRGQLNVPDTFTRLILSVLATGLAPRSFYQPHEPGTEPHYDGFPVDFIAEAMVALGAATYQNGARTYNVVNSHNDDANLDNFIEWLTDTGASITRIDDHAQWARQFEAAMKALPDPQRRNGALPIFDAYRTPLVPDQTPPGTRFREAVGTADIGVDQDTPHIDRALIHKYVTDLKDLKLL